jgi:iron complex outermembrane receptor protein
MVILLIAAAGAGLRAQAQDEDTLRRLTLEQLLEVEVSTLGRVPETAMRLPASVTVLTGADIRRSGATTLAELLRLAPGVQVARIDGNKWAVGIRGFADRLARGMLVMIDGRAVYSPLFAGTYWELQDTLLEDVDRIEIVRGPGGTLWGANAVNGIVNVITRSAAATRGTVASVAGGSIEHASASVRHGGAVRGGFLRGYAKLAERDGLRHADGSDFDAWRMGQAGVRGDWTSAAGRHLTLQGDVYTGRLGQRLMVTRYQPPFSTRVDERLSAAGANALVRWRSSAPGAPGLELQAYYDFTARTEVAFEESRHTADVDFQQSLAARGAHRVVWGAGYRLTADDTSSLPIRGFSPASRTDQLLSAFAQDQWTLVADRLELTAGLKVEHNAYTGLEAQPSMRLLWTPAATHAVTLSATRAVRTPSRVELHYTTGSLIDASPRFLRLDPNPAFETEKLFAYEAGYRLRPAGPIYVTLAAFVNHHRDVLSAAIGAEYGETDALGTRRILPVLFANALHGNSHGVETTVDVRPASWWRLSGSYSGLRVQLTRDRGQVDLSQERRNEGGSPRHQGLLHASIDLPLGIDLDAYLRAVSRLPALAIPGYATADVRAAWQVTGRLQLEVVGRDLLDAAHPEYVGAAGAGLTEIPRSLFAGATVRW